MLSVFSQLGMGSRFRGNDGFRPQADVQTQLFCINNPRNLSTSTGLVK